MSFGALVACQMSQSLKENHNKLWRYNLQNKTIFRNKKIFLDHHRTLRAQALNSEIILTMISSASLDVEAVVLL